MRRNPLLPYRRSSTGRARKSNFLSGSLLKYGSSLNHDVILKHAYSDELQTDLRHSSGKPDVVADSRRRAGSRPGGVATPQEWRAGRAGLAREFPVAG